MSRPGTPSAPVRLGDRIAERRLDVTQPLVDRYAEVSGDRNPLHIDPAFAATTAFGRTIAHGLLSLAVVSHALAEWGRGAWSAGGELEATFVGPVLVGEQLVVTGEVVGLAAAPDGGGGLRAECRVECRAGQAGERLVVVATAWLPLDGPESGE